jgi:hypothetical protein
MTETICINGREDVRNKIHVLLQQFLPAILLDKSSFVSHMSSRLSLRYGKIGCNISGCLRLVYIPGASLLKVSL